jgi:hypothetical protein
MKKENFNRLKESVNQAIQHAKGEKDLKTTLLEKPKMKAEFRFYKDYGNSGNWGEMDTLGIEAFEFEGTTIEEAIKQFESLHVEFNWICADYSYIQGDKLIGIFIK